MKTKTIDFSKFSSIRIGPIVEVALIENDVVPHGHTIVGSANNLLISPTPPPLMILSKEYDFITSRGRWTPCRSRYAGWTNRLLLQKKRYRPFRISLKASRNSWGNAKNERRA